MARLGRSQSFRPLIQRFRIVGTPYSKTLSDTLTLTDDLSKISVRLLSLFEYVGIYESPGYSLYFDGTTYVTTPSFAITNADGTLTISFWARCVQRSVIQYFFSEAGAASSSYLRTSRAASSDDLQLNFATGAANSQITATGFFTGYDDTAVHVAIVADYTNKSVKFYRNGSLFTTQTTGSTMSFPSVNRAKGLGQLFQASSGFLNGGYVDELRLYNRSLSTEEISALYKGGQGFRGIVGGSCVLAYNMDEGTGTTTADISGNSRTGTLNGNTWGSSLAGASLNGLLKGIAKSLAESVTPSDIFAKAASFPRSFTDTITLSDVFSKQTQRTFAESTTLSDVLSRLTSRVYTEVVTVTDSLTKQGQKILSETVTLTDFSVRQAQRIFSETATLTDSLIKQGQRAFAEVVTLSDVLIRRAAKTYAEAVTLTDSFIKQVGKVLAEVVTLTDTFLISSDSFITYTLSEIVTLSDSLIKQASRRLSEAVTLTDSFIRQTYKLFAETITSTDAFQKVRSLVRTLTETLSLTDTFTKRGSFVRSFTETLSLTDLLRRALNGTTTIWSMASKVATLFTSPAKPSTTFTQPTKPSSIWTSPNKP